MASLDQQHRDIITWETKNGPFLRIFRHRTLSNSSRGRKGRHSLTAHAQTEHCVVEGGGDAAVGSEDARPGVGKGGGRRGRLGSAPAPQVRAVGPRSRADLWRPRRCRSIFGWRGEVDMEGSNERRGRGARGKARGWGRRTGGRTRRRSVENCVYKYSAEGRRMNKVGRGWPRGRRRRRRRRRTRRRSRSGRRRRRADCQWWKGRDLEALKADWAEQDGRGRDERKSEGKRLWTERDSENLERWRAGAGRTRERVSTYVSSWIFLRATNWPVSLSLALYTTP